MLTTYAHLIVFLHLALHGKAFCLFKVFISKIIGGHFYFSLPNIIHMCTQRATLYMVACAW